MPRKSKNEDKTENANLAEELKLLRTRVNSLSIINHKKLSTYRLLNRLNLLHAPEGAIDMDQELENFSAFSETFQKAYSDEYSRLINIIYG